MKDLTSPSSINLRVFATLRRCLNGAESVEVQIEKGDKVADVLARAGIPVDEAKIVFLDGRKGDSNSPVAGVKSVGVFPAIGGG